MSDVLHMNDPDAHIRAAAFSAMEKLVYNQPDGFLPWDVIHKGFQVGAEHIHFANRVRGIFKPKQMSAALSIKTTVPREGRPTWYRDQGLALSKLDYATGLWNYELAHGGLNDPTNQALQMAMYRSAPLIYFIGVREGTYQPVFPVWVEEFDLDAGHVLLATTDINDSRLSSVAGVRNNLPQSVETSWSLRTVRARNHQAWFSTRTKAAYRWRCAFSGLPIRELLVGAHIVPDAEGGPASVRNGICMSTLHHTAFDSNLIGVAQDFRIHVSPLLRDQKDGVLLANLKNLEGQRLHLPDNPMDQPDLALLEKRFNEFQRRALN